MWEGMCSYNLLKSIITFYLAVSFYLSYYLAYTGNTCGLPCPLDGDVASSSSLFFFCLNSTFLFTFLNVFRPWADDYISIWYSSCIFFFSLCLASGRLIPFLFQCIPCYFTFFAILNFTNHLLAHTCHFLQSSLNKLLFLSLAPSSAILLVYIFVWLSIHHVKLGLYLVLLLRLLITLLLDNLYSFIALILSKSVTESIFLYLKCCWWYTCYIPSSYCRAVTELVWAKLYIGHTPKTDVCGVVCQTGYINIWLLPWYLTSAERKIFSFVTWQWLASAPLNTANNNSIEE